MADRLRVVLIKPSKYAVDGAVERFRRGFMPNSTLAHLASLTPAEVDGVRCDVTTIDEYVQTDLEYLRQLAPIAGDATLVALVGVQSHQIHRALDLAALARRNGVEKVVIGGPHAMTCDTTELQGRGIGFALAEAELVWSQILHDAVGSGSTLLEAAETQGTMTQGIYGGDRRWQTALDSPVLRPPSRRDLRRYAVPLLGVYPARGCPYVCNFCSVIKIAGRAVRSQPVATTLASLRAAKQAGVRFIMFTSDNFNKIPDAPELLRAMIDERIRLPFFVQCDAMVYRQEELIELMARAGCFQMFVGAESFSREALRSAHKMQNHPDRYADILALCRKHGISSHFSNILGFPSDTEASIAEHLRILKSLSPDLASFYVLTPIPGTEQYDEFRGENLITEKNLDRFDGSAIVWRHPHIAPQRLMELLYGAYRSYCAAPSVLSKLARTAARRWDYRTTGELSAILGYAVQSRLGARSHTHPMAGGIGRVRRDHARDYEALRRSTFGVDLIALPASLTLSAADQALNRQAKLAVS